MIKVRCIKTCWMPQETGSKVLEKYEDNTNEDVFEIPEERLEEFLSSGNFESIK